MKTRNSLLAALAAAASFIGLVGCSSNDSGSDSDMNPQFAELMKRPDAHQVLDQYRKTMDGIKGELVNKIGIREFANVDTDPNGSVCGSDYPEVDAADAWILRFSSGDSPDPIPENKWTEALALVSNAVKFAGFTHQKVIVNRPNNHEVDFQDKYGATLIFGTAAQTVLSVRTGCHLTPEAHKRGKPAD